MDDENTNPESGQDDTQGQDEGQGRDDTETPANPQAGSTSTEESAESPAETPEFSRNRPYGRDDVSHYENNPVHG